MTFEEIQKIKKTVLEEWDKVKNDDGLSPSYKGGWDEGSDFVYDLFIRALEAEDEPQ